MAVVGNAAKDIHAYTIEAEQFQGVEIGAKVSLTLKDGILTPTVYKRVGSLVIRNLYRGFGSQDTDGLESSIRFIDWAKAYVQANIDNGNGLIMHQEALVKASQRFAETYQKQSQHDNTNRCEIIVYNFNVAANIFSTGNIALTGMTEEALKNKSLVLIELCRLAFASRSMDDFENDVKEFLKINTDDKLDWDKKFRPTIDAKTLGREVLRGMFSNTFGIQSSLIVLEWVKAFLQKMGSAIDLPANQSLCRNIAETFMALSITYQKLGKNDVSINFKQASQNILRDSQKQDLDAPAPAPAPAPVAGGAAFPRAFEAFEGFAAAAQERNEGDQGFEDWDVQTRTVPPEYTQYAPDAYREE